MTKSRQRHKQVAHSKPAFKMICGHPSHNTSITAHLLLVTIAVLAVVPSKQLVVLAQLQQQVTAANLPLNNMLQQYQRSSTDNTNNFLVEQQQQRHQPRVAPFSAQSLPLIRQQFQSSSADLDNVIESTTSNTILSSSSYSASSQRPLIQQTCQLPPIWTGRWYQSNKEPIRVTNTEISDKGLCRDKRGDKYLFEYTKPQQAPCLTCLVINERHFNILQYKESTCQPIPVQYLNRTTNSLNIDADHSLLDLICSDITGDAQLESLFRLDTPAIECPISGKYHFNYDNCREPLSSLDSCIDKKQLNFKFSACPDVPGSESKCK